MTNENVKFSIITAMVMTSGVLTGWLLGWPLRLAANAAIEQLCPTTSHRVVTNNNLKAAPLFYWGEAKYCIPKRIKW